MSIFKNTFKVLRPKDRTKLSILFFLILLNVFLEMLGIGLIFPILGFLISEKFLLEYSNYLNILSPLFEINRNNLTIFFSIMLIVVFLIKNLIGLYFAHYKYKFTYSLLNYFSKKMYSKYINKDILFFSETNSSIPIRNIENVSTFTEGLNQFLFFLIDIIFLVSVLILLFYISIINTIFLLIAVSIALLIFRMVTKKRMTDLGVERQSFLQKKIQNIVESMSAIKEIKIFFKESFFLKKFIRSVENYSYASRIFETYQATPRLMLEVLGVFCLASILIINTMLGYELDLVISTIAIFGISAFKLLPSLSRIIAATQFFYYYYPVMNTTVEELNKTHETDNIEISDRIIKKKFHIKFGFEKFMEIKNLNFSFGSKKILKNINLTIKKNNIIGIVGKSGSGKSTLANLIVGILKPENGKIIFDQKYELQEALRLNENLFGYIPQSTFLLDDTIKNNVTFGQDEENFDSKLFWDCLKISRIDAFVNSLPDRENALVGEKGVKISGGQAQRLGIARAMYRSPDIMILDEATSSLDLETEKDFINSINEIKGKLTLIIITHRIASLDICDKIYLIEEGILKPFQKKI
jgi:ABC-type bacteriocin/lantibiotic exporter with double-glycine peptidase domain